MKGPGVRATIHLMLIMLEATTQSAIPLTMTLKCGT